MRTPPAPCRSDRQPQQWRGSSFQEEGPGEVPSLDKEPGKHPHIRWGEILPDERGKGGVNAIEHAQLIQRAHIQRARPLWQRISTQRSAVSDRVASSRATRSRSRSALSVRRGTNKHVYGLHLLKNKNYCKRRNSEW
jgi:hypothetical protein